MRISIAFRAFFAALFNQDKAERVQAALSTEAVPLQLEEEKPVEKPVKKAETPRQNEAITLLAALQREARFVDFVSEPLEGFTDAQIGAAARSVHDDCMKVLQRFFEMKPIFEEPEQTRIELTEVNPARVQLQGNVSKTPPLSGTLLHSGWQATKTDIPKWIGDAKNALIIAPAEVEVS